MKRSEINTIMREALAFLREKQFLLPPFATWTPADWRTKGAECQEIIDQQLGWDITDLGAEISPGRGSSSSPFATAPPQTSATRSVNPTVKRS